LRRASTSRDFARHHHTWLDNIAADPARASMAKVVRNKPATATDACWNASGVRIDETQSNGPGNPMQPDLPALQQLRLVAARAAHRGCGKCARAVDAAIAAGIYSPMTFSAGEVNA